MTLSGTVQLLLWLVLLLAVVRPLGSYMLRVFAGDRFWGALGRIGGTLWKLNASTCAAPSILHAVRVT